MGLGPEFWLTYSLLSDERHRSTWRRIPRVGRLSGGLCKQQIPYSTCNAQFITFSVHEFIAGAALQQHAAPPRACCHKVRIMSTTWCKNNLSPSYLRSLAMQVSSFNTPTVQLCSSSFSAHDHPGQLPLEPDDEPVSKSSFWFPQVPKFRAEACENMIRDQIRSCACFLPSPTINFALGDW